MNTQSELKDLKTIDVLESTAAGVLVTNADGRITYANGRFSELTGYDGSMHDTWQKLCRAAFPDTEYRRQFVKSWKRGTVSYDVRFRCSNGAFRYFIVTVNRTNNQCISSFSDSTEKVLAINQYKRHHELLECVCGMTRVGIYELNLLNKSAFWSEVAMSIHEFQNQIDTWQEYAGCFREGVSREQVHEAFQLAEHEGQESSLDALFVSGSGQERWLRLRIKAEFLDGECLWLYGIVQDIHEQKLIEDELSAEKEQFERAQSIAHLGSWEWNFLTNEAYWSDEFYRICGLEPGSCLPSAEAGFAMIHPEDQEKAVEAVNGARYKGEPYKIEKRIVRPDGEIRWVRSQGEVLHDPEGKAEKISGTFLDISESKAAWDALEYREKRYRLLVEATASSFAVWEADARGIIVEESRNWQAFSGQKPGEELGDGWLNAVHPDDRPFARETWQKAIAENTIPDAEFRLHTAEDRWRWVRLIASKMTDSSGRILKWVVMCLDINEKKHAIQEEIARKTAEASNSAKSVFLANMSHEIRTPLNAIIGFSHILERDVHMNELQLRHLRAITRSGEHLLNLINDILDLSRIEAGQLSLNTSDFNLFSLLDDLDLMFRLRAESQGLRFLFDLHESVPQYIHCDESKLRQIFVNLLSNAVKFTESGGVAVRIRADQNHLDSTERPLLLIVEIEDSGPGINKADIERIFQSFQQSREGIRAGGTGLGLAISRKLVELLGGELSVKSTEETGSIFRFAIPAGLADSADFKKTDPGCRIIGLETGDRTIRIMIVDDREDNRELLQALLEPCGFSLRQAENGREAVELFKVWNPDLILLDMGMPVMDGYEATRIIKQSEGGKETCVVAVTASAFEENEAVIRATEVNDYVRKPFRSGEIYRIIGEHLGLEFIMAEDNEGCADPEEIMLTADTLKVIPESSRIAMYEAVEMGNISELKDLIAQIDESGIARALLALARQYDYEKLSRLLSSSLDGT
ncbi:PAS domain-containing protein [Spirochaeta dissipatitropha]